MSLIAVNLCVLLPYVSHPFSTFNAFSNGHKTNRVGTRETEEGNDRGQGQI